MDSRSVVELGKVIKETAENCNETMKSRQYLDQSFPLSELLLQFLEISALRRQAHIEQY
jgi:hypothetical protein